MPSQKAASLTIQWRISKKTCDTGADPGFGNGGGAKICWEGSYIYERSELRAKRV